jgi:hypothetical protein
MSMLPLQPIRDVTVAGHTLWREIPLHKIGLAMMSSCRSAEMS